MSEMFDRVGTALDEKLRCIGAGYKNIDLGPMLALAAIEAMREPTEGMRRAFYDENYGDFDRTWQILYEAMLKETPNFKG